MLDETKILLDLQAFRDPATELQSESGAIGFLIQLTREGEDRRYFFNRRTGAIDRRDMKKRQWINFASLLASEDFASLTAFSETQRRLLRAKLKENYLKPYAVMVKDNNETGQLKQDDILHAISPATKEYAHFVLIDGPAGVGKTFLIERMVLDRAESGKGAPILHVTSRGRRLTNLRDALAGTLDELRARFRANEIAALVRNGVLQVALDGFDEFVDPEGYKDAWAALKDFIRECDNAGPLILAGRDTFFDQQSFETRITNVSGKAEITVIRLREVSPQEAKRWLLESGWDQSAIDSEDTNNYLRRGSYMLRPFFLSRIVGLRGWSTLKEARTSPQSFIIDSMISREAKILSRPLTASEEVISNGLYKMFEYIAEDMAEREVDTIPLHYLRFVGEVAFEGLVPKDEISRLLHSIGSIALLERGETSDLVRFPHTEIANRFLIRALVQQLSEGLFPAYLSRIIMGMDKIEAFVERLFETSNSDGSRVIRTLLDTAKNERRTARFDVNLGALTLSSISRSELFPVDQVIEDINTDEVRMMFETANVTISNSLIYRLDVKNCDISNIEFANTTATFLIGDKNTKCGPSMPNIDVIQVQDPDATVTMRSDEQISAWIADRTSVNPSEGLKATSNLPIVKHFDRVCRRFLAQIQIRDVPEDAGSFLLHGAAWEEIKRILLSEKRLKIMERAAQGPSRDFYTIIDPAELLSPTTEEGRRIRARVVERAKALESQ